MGNLQSSPSSSNTTLMKKHDVFLSFRGADTRDCFTSHLYKALRRKQIETFIDYEIEKGDELSSALTTAINESKISVVIFSKDYATAKWCLRELVEILECKKMKNQIVLPVFYRVDPSDVRHQTGSFHDSFVKHETNSQKEVKTWRDALAEAGGIIGWRSSVGRTDAELVKEIVNDIWKKLMSEYVSPDFGKLVGLERIKHVTSLLCLEERLDCLDDRLDFRIIGIWGMGGIGKTTLADAIFNKYSNQFEGVCFIQNVRERLANSGGLVSMKKEILSEVLKEDDLKLNGLTIPPKIKERLNRIKLFIVLDDVDDFIQMEDLVKGVGGLGQGSRIIITSRNKQVLRNCRVNDDNIYEVKGFNNHEALQLFCNYAFDKNCHGEDLMVNRLVNFAEGSPLALKLLGSLLYKKSKQEWGSVVNKFKLTNLSRGIFDVLKISYDGLTDIEKDIFLDIACFLKGGKKDYVEKILDDCDYSLGVLIDKSLITISHHHTIEMHDLLEEMGRDIVNKESPNEIGTRSRMWKQKDVLCTLKNDYGTPKVQGIFLDMSDINKDIHLSPQAFKKMYNLRLLKFHLPTLLRYSKVNFSEGLSDLSDMLRSLIWYGYPLQALPSNFNPNNLVELDLSGSNNLERLWEDRTHVPKLRWLNLSGCTRVTEIPDLSKSPLLESIDLRHCSSLLDFPQLAQRMNYLVKLVLSGSSNLKRLWKHPMEAPKLRWLNLSRCTRVTEIQGLSKSPLLEYIDLEDCSSLLDFPQLAQHLKNLRYLGLRGCNSLRSFPSDIHFESLTYLDLSKCNNLTKFGSQISGNNITSLDLSGTAIKELHHSIAHLKGLEELVLRRCKNLETLPSGICKLTSLRHLDLSGCTRVTKIPDLSESPLLEAIDLRDCSSLLDFPQLAQHLKNLRYLDPSGCNSLRSFPSDIHFESLTSLDLSNCNNLTKFGSQISGNNITRLDLSGTAIKELHHSIGHLNGLEELFLRRCENLETLPSGIFNLSSLRHLDLSDCSRLEILPENLGNLISLVYLSAKRAAIKELPHSIAHLNGLEELFLGGCKNLETLPSGICNLTSLQRLDLSDCSRLKILPEKLGNLKSLKYLSVHRIAISQLPSSMKHLKQLKKLSCRGCRGLRFIHSSGLLGLWNLTRLFLSACNLNYIPKGIGCLSSLIELDLSLNNFHGLPQSMKELQHLKFLNLDRCNKVVSLIDLHLPSNLTHLSACDCKQLQSIPSEFYFARIINTPKSTEFIFTSCMNLEETAVGNMLARLVKYRYLGDVRFSFCYPGSEVPQWFRSTTEGSSIKFQDTFDSNLKGFAVCAVIAFEKYLFNGDIQHKLGVHFDGTCSDGNQSSPINIKLVIPYVASRNRTLIYSDHVAFGYCDASCQWRFESRFKNYSFEFWLSKESPYCRLKSCGVCPIYVEDSNTDDSDEAGTSGSRFDEEELEPHPKENKNLQIVKYAEQIEHIGGNK